MEARRKMHFAAESQGMASNTILIVGATGRQGSSVLHELSNKLRSPSLPSSTSALVQTKLKILALSRNATPPKAYALAITHLALDLHVIDGCTQDTDPIFAAHQDIDAVFAYTVPPDERPQAIPLIDAAERAGVKRFVFSSVDRGGDERSWDDHTPVPHFAEKCHVEAHLYLVCEG
ncbi:hypothetical protein DL768_002378 [Monosporascus sp. mg162]|nr:hypothetical protein DL768_002378 [Monosporascus sp. mg162]